MHNPSIPLPQIPLVSENILAGDAKAGVADVIADGRTWFRTAHDLGCDAFEINRGRSKLIDAVIGTLLSLADKRFFKNHPDSGERVAILALGGYGREEMGLSSDIDLLFLYEGKNEPYIRSVTDSILYPIWDNKMEITGATRSTADCISVGRSDLRAQTAMLDARFVAGDRLLAEPLLSHIKTQFDEKGSKQRFIRAKLHEHRTRLKRFGESVYLLEPNVKESEGGLREYHTLLWIAKAAFPGKELDEIHEASDLSMDGAEELKDGVNFLWRVRHALNLMDEKNDRLGVAQQGPIARSFGYTDGRFSAAAEQFMQAYYRNASVVHQQCRRAIEQIVDTALPKPAIMRFFRKRRLSRGIYRAGTKIYADRERLGEGPEAILKVFALANKKGLDIDAKTKEFIMQLASPIGEGDLFTEAANRLWMDMFLEPAFLSRTIKQMHECRLFTRFFPEMEPLVHRIQHDGFHYYTADEHSINAVREIGFLYTKDGHRTFPVLSGALSKVKRTHVLSFATLFHDVGKGRGGNHAEVGAGLVRAIAKRLGWTKDDIETASFLVLSHLLIPTLAYRRDVKDPHLIERLAQTVETTETLAMLYLLAFADVRAIGPHIWSDWKGGLLAELYLNTLSHIEGAGEAAKKQRMLMKKLHRVYELMGRTMSHEELGNYFASVPERYLTSTRPQMIAQHLKMTGKLAGETVVTEVVHAPDRGMTELSLVTHDAAGLFAKIAGVLSLNGVNIIDAQLYTLPDGTVLDELWVTDLNQRPVTDDALWQEIGRELKGALTGELDVHESVKRQTKKRLLSPERKGSDTKIEIDNDVSVRETVVDVVTNDRAGLLYDICRTFFELGCTIERAKITTYADRVIDVFYIRDAGGEKITSKERLKQIQDAINEAVL